MRKSFLDRNRNRQNALRKREVSKKEDLREANRQKLTQGHVGQTPSQSPKDFKGGETFGSHVRTTLAALRGEGRDCAHFDPEAPFPVCPRGRPRLPLSGLRSPRRRPAAFSHPAAQVRGPDRHRALVFF